MSSSSRAATKPPAPIFNRLNEIEDRFGRYTRATNGRHRGFGGTSSRWGGRMIPIAHGDASERAHVGLSAWPFSLDELSGHEAEIERIFKVAPGSFERLDGEKTSRPAHSRPRTHACPALGQMSELHALQSRNPARRRTATVVGDRHPARRDGLRFRAGPRPGAAQERHGPQPRRALVAREGGPLHLAAGTIETTRLLLLLDAASDHRAFEGCEVLGRYFQDHLKAESPRSAGGMRRPPTACSGIASSPARAATCISNWRDRPRSGTASPAPSPMSPWIWPPVRSPTSRRSRTPCSGGRST